MVLSNGIGMVSGYTGWISTGAPLFGRRDSNPALLGLSLFHPFFSMATAVAISRTTFFVVADVLLLHQLIYGSNDMG